MKISTLITAVALSFATSLSLAQQGPQPPQPTETAAKTEPVQTETAAPTSPMISAMQQRLEEMQSFWDKMSQTTDPAERQKLMQEYRQKMQELAGTMHGLRSGPGRMGDMPCMMAGHHMMMGMMAAYQQMDKRLDLMQTLLEQLLKEREKKE